MLSLVTGTVALGGMPAAQAQSLGLALTGVPDLNAVADQGLVSIDANTLEGLANLIDVEQADVTGLDSRAASEIASARGLVGPAVDKLPDVDRMQVSHLKAASVENNSLVGPLNALCGPLAATANCSSTTVDKHVMGHIADRDETLVGHGRGAL